MFQVCAPAFLYLCISLFDIIFNAYLGLHDYVLVKIIVIIAVSLFLNILCEKGFSEISWLIVLLSFLVIGIIVFNNLGCYKYNYVATNYVATNYVPTNYVPTNNIINDTSSYEHIPMERSDPAYQS